MSLSNLQSSVLSTIQESQLEDQYLSLAEELKVEQRRSEELVSENRVLSNDLLCANEKVATLERKLDGARIRSVLLSSDNTKLKEKIYSLEIELSQSNENVDLLVKRNSFLSGLYNKLSLEISGHQRQLHLNLENLERLSILQENTYESELKEKDIKINELEELQQMRVNAVKQKISEKRILSDDLKSANENIATLERKLACALNKSLVLSFYNTKLKEKNCSLEIELCELSEQVGKDRRDNSKSQMKNYLHKLFGCFYRKRNKN